jgi:hypothetical protein
MTITQLPLPAPGDDDGANLASVHRLPRRTASDGSRSRDLSSWALRKQRGDAHEKRVAEELEKHGWEVNKWGQALLTPKILAAFQSNRTGMCWTPDFVVARGERLACVDAKGNMTSDGRDVHFVERGAVDAHMRHFICYGVQTFYVFGDLSVITPNEVVLHGRIRRGSLNGSGKPCYTVPVQAARPFGAVFGEPGQGIQMRDAA